VKLGSSALEKPEEISKPAEKEEKVERLEEDDNDSIIIVDDLDDEDDDITIDNLGDLEEPLTPPTDIELIRAKLKKSLAELEDARADMSNTFTSTSTISTTIQSLRGMLDALKKDQMNILSKK
jgi:hypothetical protein